MLAMCRAGTLPLEVEKGRWRGLPRHERICQQCATGEVEDLYHILTCLKHTDLQQELIQTIKLTRNVENVPLNIQDILDDNRLLTTLSNFIISIMKNR